jgi:hypothetical protein
MQVVAHSVKATIGMFALVAFLLPAQTYAQLAGPVYSNAYVSVSNAGDVSDTGAGFNFCIVSPAGGTACGNFPHPITYPYTHILDSVIANWGVPTSTVSTSTAMCWVASGGGACTPAVPVVISAGVLQSVNGQQIFTSGQSLDWNGLYIPLLFSTSSAAIAASSSLWASLDLASTTVSCNSGNIFTDGLCAAGTYLFMPNPNLMNSYVQMPSVLGTKFPFSWFYGAKNALSGLSASSSDTFFSYSIDFSAVDPATSTAMGGILPNVYVLSTSTVSRFLPDAQRLLLRSMLGYVIWLTFMLDVFLYVRHRLVPV